MRNQATGWILGWILVPSPSPHLHHLESEGRSWVPCENQRPLLPGRTGWPQISFPGVVMGIVFPLYSPLPIVSIVSNKRLHSVAFAH